MKPLVSGFHALHINELARLPLIPFSKSEWICRTQSGTPAVTVPITVLPEAPWNCSFHSGQSECCKRFRSRIPKAHEAGNGHGLSAPHVGDGWGLFIMLQLARFSAGAATA